MNRRAIFCITAAAAAAVLSIQFPSAAASGKAVLSQYAAPNMKDARKQAAEDWVMGVLGGDTSRIGNVFAIFGASGGGIAKASNFLFLRGACWPASTWAVSQGRIKDISALSEGARVTLSCPDIEGRIAEQQRKFKGASPEIARVLAEWRTAYDVASLKDRDKIGGITITRDAPINAYGKIFLGKNSLEELLASPEKTLTEVLKYISDKKLKGAWVRRMITWLRTQTESSSTVVFGEEFLRALEEVKL